jgi:hypothetical protein
VSYGLKHVKLNLSGSHGNVFHILGAAKGLVRKVEGFKAANEFARQADGTAWREMGGDWSYNDVLRTVKDKIGLTFVADGELTDVDKDLYELNDHKEVWI